jgi:hypothetical protein
MEELYFDPRRHRVPSSWDALSEAQLARCCLILHEAKEGMTARLLAVLLEGQCRRKSHVFASEEDAERAVAFLLEGPERTKCPAGRIRLGGIALAGPPDRMRTCTFEEFIHADAAMSKFRATGDWSHLDRLCAILFRPPRRPWERGHGWDGDPRSPAGPNPDELARRAGLFSKADAGLRLAAGAYFMGCMAMFARRHSNIFERGGEGGQSPWMKSVSAMAKGLHNYRAVLEQPLGVALFEISQMAERAKAMEESLNQKKS